MKKNGAEFVMRISMVLGIALIVTGAVFVSQVKPAYAQQQMVTICHAAGQEGTLTFTTLTIPYNAAYANAQGEGGHFTEGGTAAAGHENDYLGACIIQATPVPPTATPVTPTATPVTPTATPTDPGTGGSDTTPVPTLGVPVTGSQILIPVTGIDRTDLAGGVKDFNKGKFLMSLGFAFLGLGIVSYGISKKQ